MVSGARDGAMGNDGIRHSRVCSGSGEACRQACRAFARCLPIGISNSEDKRITGCRVGSRLVSAPVFFVLPRFLRFDIARSRAHRGDVIPPRFPRDCRNDSDEKYTCSLLSSARRTLAKSNRYNSCARTTVNWKHFHIISDAA